MDPLISLSPDQLNALSPESLQTILSQEKHNDIFEMKYIVEHNYHKQKKEEHFKKLLLKYKDQKFYLMSNLPAIYKKGRKYSLGKGYHTFYTYKATSWRLYTEEELQILLPFNVDIKKICYSKGGTPFESVCYPSDYTSFAENSKGLSALSHTYKNIYYVHPQLFELVRRVFS